MKPLLPTSPPPLSTPIPVLSKVARRLIPFMCVLYLLAYLDRVNVGFAGLQMTVDLHLTDAVFGLGAGMFFVGYFLFEVPSNLILHRTGASKWIARIMISWGIVAMAMMFVRGSRSFYGLRLLLGMAEAGFFPGMVLYLTYWFPRRYRARTTAFFFTATAVAGILGGPISGALLSLNGVGGLRGWQWLFLLEGLPSIFGGIACLLFLTDRPSSARWLSESEKEILANELAADEASSAGGTHHVEFSKALGDGRLWLLSAVYFTLMFGMYGITYWMPKVIKAITGFSNQQVGWLSAIPYGVAVVAMVLIGRHSDKTVERRWHIGLCALAAAIGLLAVPWCHDAMTAIAALSLAAAGVWSAIGPFWAVCGEFLQGSASAGGIAAINSLGCLGGLVGPYIVGLSRSAKGASAAGIGWVALALVLGCALVLLLPRSEALKA
jgi:sugar phosphate permease